jgi:large subunit ribosomal protein L4
MSDSTNFQAKTYTAGGTERDSVALPATPFDGTVHVPVMHQAVKAYLANQRQGTASTKTRGFVTGGNQKPWKQKGTGRARQGSTRAPQWVGGGTVFGPLPRTYEQKVSKQVKALARRSALNARARENAIFVIDRFEYAAPKTSQILALISALGLAEQKVLVLTDGNKPNVFLSGRNLPLVHVMAYNDASTYHILWSDAVLIEASAIGHALTPVAESAAKAPKKKAVKAAAAEADAPATTSAPKAKKKTAAASAEGDAPVAKKKAAPKKKES